MLNTRHSIAVVAAVSLLALWNAETAQAKGITGHCGIHFGALYRIDTGGARYHARIGPRDGHVGGTMHCSGKVFIRRSGGTALVAGRAGSWDPFNWVGWNWHGVLALNGTAATCVGFGLALAGEAPTGAVDTWLTASAGAGCVGGVGYIARTYLVNGDDYCGRASSACNGPGRVLLH